MKDRLADAAEIPEIAIKDRLADAAVASRVGVTADPLLTIPEIAARCRLSIDTVRWYRHCGTGPKMFRLGKRVVARESDVEAWIEKARTDALSAAG